VTCQVFIAEQLKEFEVRLAKLAQARDEEERERERLRAEAEERQRQAREAEDKRRAVREAEERVVKMSEQHEQLEKLVAELRSLLLTASKAKSTKQPQPTITAAKRLLEDVKVSLDNYLNINENTIHPKRHADASAVMKELVKEFQKYG
jgi:chromosome segregation ATPase